jgi:predicted dithiol-disulfide oxidoreductase (DUF899 family)
MIKSKIALPRIVSQDEWVAARKELLAYEWWRRHDQYDAL